MALKDIFDPDKRSKDDLRSEIERRDEQIADLRTVSELRTATTSIDTRAKDSQVPDQETQTGQTHGEFEAEIASLKAEILEQRQLLEESQEKTRELENLLGEKAAAYRLLMEREARVEAMELQIDVLLSQFGITDKAQVVSLPDRLTAVVQELEELRRGTGAQELSSLREQIEKANELATRLANERDELVRSLARERERSSASEAVRLGNVLGAAQAEIRRLQGGISDEVRKQRCRAESAEKKIEETAVELRNLKTQAEGFRKQAELADRNLSTANKQVDRLTQDLASERSKHPAVVEREETSFTNPIVLRWLADEGGPEAAGVPKGWLGRTGEGPWPDVLFAGTLEDVAYKFWRLPDSDLRHLVVGRKGWTKEELLAQIDAVDGGPLRIYSQEMFLAKLMTGRDPFDSVGEELLLAFAKGHPALEFLLGLLEPWPTVCDGRDVPIPVDGDDYGVTESPLHLLGYHVGATSRITESRRRVLLTECFKTNSLKFTDESSDDYRRKWGRGGSAQRLYRMAVHIKWLADGQGKDSRKPQARLDWVDDLKWLRKTFHQPMTRRFRWP